MTFKLIAPPPRIAFVIPGVENKDWSRTHDSSTVMKIIGKIRLQSGARSAPTDQFMR